MKVLFDHQIFSSQKYGGISRYFYNLNRELEKTRDISTSSVLTFSNNQYISHSEIFKHTKFFPSIDFKGKGKLMSSMNKILSKRRLTKKQFDVFHPTYYDPYFLKHIGSRPFVLTVHDMIHEKFGNMFSRFDNTSKYKKLLVEKASKIIAVSENTKKDLVEMFGTDESKVEVIYHAYNASVSIYDGYEFRMVLPEEYILFVGNRGGYKNFVRFIKGVSRLLLKNRHLCVVCVGGGGFTFQELKLFKILKVKYQVLQLNLNDSQLCEVYKKACLFCFPSIYEGFGIPILESFYNECPVICSNTSSLPEVAKNGAIYFDPYSESSIFMAANKVLESEFVRTKLVESGLSRLKNFSWEISAVKTKTIYEDVI